MTASWNTVEPAGHAVDLFAPIEPRTDVALLVLPDHGARGTESDALTSALALASVVAVAPHGDGCWWLDMVEPAFDPELPPLRFLTDHVLPLVEQQFGIRPPNVKLLGWGAGGQGVLQLAYRRPRDFPAVAAIDPAIDFHELHGQRTPLDDLFPTREAARQQTAILRMQGVGWPRRQLVIADPNGFWFEGAERLDMKLRSIGIPAESDFTQTARGDGARFFEQHAARAVEFLLAERVSLPVIRPDP
jgi:pimeloyl-ACP methyl ester carboxylesterase